MKKLTSLLWLLLVLAGGCKHSDPTPALPDGTYLKPLWLGAEPRPDGIALAWTPVIYFEEGMYGPVKSVTPAQYEIYISETGEDALQKVAVIDGSIRQYVIQNQPSGKTLCAQVKAIHPQLTGSESNVVTTNTGQLGTSALLFPSLTPTPNLIYGAWSNGSLVYADWNGLSVRRPDGTVRKLVSNGFRPVLSPDGRYVAFLGGRNSNSSSYNTELFIETVESGLVRSVAVRRAIHAVEWSHDGNWLAYAADGTGGELWKVSATSPQTTLLTTGDWNTNQDRIAWSPDDAFVVMTRTQNPPGIKRYVTNLVRIPATGGAAQTLLASTWHDEQPAYSPDSQRLAFISDRSGYTAIWVLTLKTGQLQQITKYDGQFYYINRLDWRNNTQLTYSARLPAPDDISLKVITLP
jgi:WD40-like Beta Propeller Repeat